VRQWYFSVFKDIWWSLQQRVCSGFPPDSLFTTFPKKGIVTPKSGAKVRKQLKTEDFVDEYGIGSFNPFM
jgi:hypothetical protein